MKPIDERIGTHEQIQQTRAMELFARIVQPDDKVASWLTIRDACETLGADSVIDDCLDCASGDAMRDQPLFERAVGACIYHYHMGSVKKKNREFYAAQWLLSDLIHGQSGMFAESFEQLEIDQMMELANFGLKISNTRVWGLNCNGADNIFSLVSTLYRTHHLWRTSNTKLYQLKVLEETSQLNLDYFRFDPYFTGSTRMNDSHIYMYLEDALVFVIAVIHQYPIEGFFERPTAQVLLDFIEELYDEYLYEDDLGLFEYFQTAVNEGSCLAESTGYDVFNFNLENDWLVEAEREELILKISMLDEFFEAAKNRCLNGYAHP